MACPPGTFQDLEGQASCKDVGPGFFSGGRLLQLPCPPGRFCPGGASNSQPCDGVSYFQDEMQQAACKAVRNCSANEFELAGPTAMLDRVCVACPGGCNRSPRLSVTQPAGNSSVVVGTPVTFAATVSDPEDPMDGLLVTLASPIQGQLWAGQPSGSGQVTVVLSDLVIGRHDLRCTVQDSQAASTSVVLTVLFAAGSVCDGKGCWGRCRRRRGRDVEEGEAEMGMCGLQVIGLFIARPSCSQV